MILFNQATPKPPQCLTFTLWATVAFCDDRLCAPLRRYGVLPETEVCARRDEAHANGKHVGPMQAEYRGLSLWNM